ncbi:MAG: hypothetical protein ROR55_20805 [Devosia sp.]
MDALRDPDQPITAHNANFDRTLLRAQLAPRLGLPAHVGEPERWRCTMVKAMTLGFPGALDACGRILGLPNDTQKLTDGKRLIHRFCKPAPRNHKADRYDRHSHPEEWERFCAYAVRDIDAMREIDRRLPDWNYRGEELALYHLDQRINDRGASIDKDLVAAGARAAATEKDRIAERCAQLTNGLVPRPTMREALRLYLNDVFGLGLSNTQAATLRQVLAERGDALPSNARELIHAALAANKTSTAKYKALAPAVSPDGRFRGSLQFAGAARTRRWSGRTLQIQNLASRGLPPQDDIDLYIDALKNDVHDLLFEDQMLFASAALRGVIVAPPSRKLVVADLSNIEGRANAWLAGETWKLKAFEAFDRGEGPDLYNITAGMILGKNPSDITKSERNAFGKVPELACGYASGVNGIQTFARAYGITMVDHWPTIKHTMGAYADAAADNYAVWGRERAPEMAELEWIASETIKLAWRDRHPAITRLWHACETAARRALAEPGRTFIAGPKLRFKLVRFAGHRYLAVRLPSGQFLTYFAPRVEPDDTLTYMGLNTLTRQWERIATYGGKFCENFCQSVSRDAMAASIPAIEADGFEILFTVHDEIVTEVPDGPGFSADRLAALMATPPAWAAGFPLAAAGFEAPRYRKDA